MGIPNLNKLFIEKCTTYINKISISTLKNKTIVIDTSIYLYKFMGQEKFIENFYLMMAIFEYNEITPIFIFDGKPPDEKKAILKKRKIDKDDAEKKYKELEINIKEKNISNDEKNEIQNIMDKLKKQFIRIKEDDIKSVKNLISYFGFNYIEANGEADVLCANMVINGEAWACLSDDMDMFVFGCNRVLRYISLMNHTVIFYDFDNILTNLNINLQNFRILISICGTDYNIDQNFNIKAIYNQYKKFIKSNTESDFIDWIDTKYIKNKNNIIETSLLFQSNQINVSNLYKNEKDKNKLIQFLDNYGFIFL